MTIRRYSRRLRRLIVKYASPSRFCQLSNIIVPSFFVKQKVKQFLKVSWRFTWEFQPNHCPMVQKVHFRLTSLMFEGEGEGQGVQTSHPFYRSFLHLALVLLPKIESVAWFPPVSLDSHSFRTLTCHPLLCRLPNHSCSLFSPLLSAQIYAPSVPAQITWK